MRLSSNRHADGRVPDSLDSGLSSRSLRFEEKSHSIAEIFSTIDVILPKSNELACRPKGDILKA